MSWAPNPVIFNRLFQTHTFLPNTPAASSGHKSYSRELVSTAELEDLGIHRKVVFGGQKCFIRLHGCFP